MPECTICGAVRIDLTRHLKEIHQITADVYRKECGGLIVDPSVEQKRKETCMEKYGNPNYKNEEAKRLSNKVFEGGHALSDPLIRAKASDTKQALYGDPNFTNREKAKETCLEKYGVENVANIPEVKEKKINTLMARYGKIFNLERKDLFSKEELEDMHHKQGLSIGEIAERFGQASVNITYWMKKHGLKVNKNIVIPKIKEYTDNKVEVKEYLEVCLREQRVLSFAEYGKLTADKKNQKLKRLFNSGKIYHHLLEELKSIILKPELWPDFLNKIRVGKVSC